MSSFVEYNNSKSFYTMAWISFVISFAMTYLFSISSCFTLAKVIRDKHESEKFVNKIESAKTERFLSENTSV